MTSEEWNSGRLSGHEAFEVLSTLGCHPEERRISFPTAVVRVRRPISSVMGEVEGRPMKSGEP